MNISQRLFYTNTRLENNSSQLGLSGAGILCEEKGTNTFQQIDSGALNLQVSDLVTTPQTTNL